MWHDSLDVSCRVRAARAVRKELIAMSVPQPTLNATVILRTICTIPWYEGFKGLTCFQAPKGPISLSMGGMLVPIFLSAAVTHLANKLVLHSFMSPINESLVTIDENSNSKLYHEVGEVGSG